MSPAEERPADAAVGLTVSVIVPVRNGSDYLKKCLPALVASDHPPLELLVVDDASTDDSAEVARGHGARVLTLEGRSANDGQASGPACARNRAAEVARGDLLFFVDADVVVHPDTIGKAVGCLTRNPEVMAVIGSYDDRPGNDSLVSQFKNLFHHWVHQTGNEEASTFWTGCGAIRRSVFVEMGGFNEGYPRPSIEDIELGFRLRLAGHRIRLIKDMQASHLKLWTLPDLVMTDIFRRGAPWISLMLRDRYAMKDLNLSTESRLSTLLAYLVPLCLVAIPFIDVVPPWVLAGLALFSLVVIVRLNRGLYRFFIDRRGLLFTLRIFPLHYLFLMYSGVCVPFGILAYLKDRRRARKWASGPAVKQLEPLRADTAGDAGR